METQNDVLQNPDSFMQIGDFVASTFLISAISLLVVSIFLLVQFKSVPQRWKMAYLIGSMIPLIAALFTVFRTNYWITTMTNPIEFRFFDWFLTVPLMSLVFYYLLKPLGVSRWMVARLLVPTLWMLGFGYLGEALFPEQSVMWGIMGAIGFSVLIAIIIGEGFPKIFREGVDRYHRIGYVGLAILLPIGWSAYPIGYMTVPGNLLEGQISVNTIAILYNLADIFNKAGLALGVAFIASRSKTEYDAPKVAPKRRPEAFSDKKPSRATDYLHTKSSNGFGEENMFQWNRQFDRREE
ncbi:MAG: bacteriorhodopsin [Bacteroidota bacterium]